MTNPALNMLDGKLQKQTVSEVFAFSFVCLFGWLVSFFDTRIHYGSSGCPGTHYVVQADFELTKNDLPLHPEY